MSREREGNWEFPSNDDEAFLLAFQDGRGEPKYAPLPGCTNCRGTGITSKQGKNIFCSCLYYHPSN